MSAWDEVVAILCDECGKVVAEKVVLRVRKMYGGNSIYIPSKPTPQVEPVDTPTSLRKKHGISRSTAYNWLNKYRI